MKVAEIYKNIPYYFNRGGKCYHFREQFLGILRHYRRGRSYQANQELKRLVGVLPQSPYQYNRILLNSIINDYGLYFNDLPGNGKMTQLGIPAAGCRFAFILLVELEANGENALTLYENDKPVIQHRSTIACWWMDSHTKAVYREMMEKACIRIKLEDGYSFDRQTNTFNTPYKDGHFYKPMLIEFAGDLYLNQLVRPTAYTLEQGYYLFNESNRVYLDINLVINASL